MKSKSTFRKKDKLIFEFRIKDLQKTLIKPGQAIYFENPIDIFYLTGLQMSVGKLIVSNEAAHLFVDNRYLQMADAESPVPVSLAGHDAEADFILKKQIKKLLFDSSYSTYDAYLKMQALSQKIERKSSSSFALTPSSVPLKEMKAVKDKWELECMRTSAKHLWKGFQHIKKILKAGMTEDQVAMELEIFSRKHGAEKWLLNRSSLLGRTARCLIIEQGKQN